MVRTTPYLALVASVLLISLPSPQAHYRHHGKYALPDASVTSGAIDPLAIGDPSGARHVIGGIERNVCAADFRTKPIRARIKNFPRLKRAACKEYGVSKCDGQVEGDHLISIELGGCTDCLVNLWPQPMDQARVKDHYVEDVLPKLVCSGKITIRQAQDCIAKDWVACGAKYGEMK